MSINLSKKEKLFIFVSTLLIIVLLVGGYYLILSPKKAQVAMKEKQLKSQEQILSVLQTQDTTTSTITTETATNLQKQVPVKPQTEQLLLDIEKAEVTSDSFVTDMQINDEEAKAQTDLEKRVDSQLNGTSEQTKDSKTESNQKTENLMPEGLKKETVDLSIEASGYPELEKFISVLEQSERIIVVESIDFTQMTKPFQMIKRINFYTFEVKISAFYMPTLTDLIDQLPKLEAPEPAHKKNPFSYFGNYSSDRVEGNGLFHYKGPSSSSRK